MSFSPYPNYRHSEIEWLGAIPSHWTVSRLGYEAWVRARLGWKGLKAEEYVDEGVALLATPDIKGLDIDFDGANRITRERYDESPEIKLREGDVLLAKDGSTLGTVNFIRELKREATVNSSIAVITAGSGTSGAFLMYYFQSKYIVSNIDSLKGGMGVPHLFQSDLVRFPIALPPLSEQHAIANFLDRETAKIDSLIQEQQRLLRLLREETISHVLSVYQQSDVTELRLERAVNVMERPVVQVDGDTYEPLGLFNRGRGLFHKEPRLAADMGDSDFYWVKPGDLIISGQFAWEGAIAFAGDAEARCVVSHRYPVLRGRPGVALTEYIYALLLTQHGTYLLNEHSRGAAGRNRPLNLKSLLREKIVLPDLQKQSVVKDQIHALSSIQAELNLQRELLQERRAALITAAVTGTIDVRLSAKVLAFPIDRARARALVGTEIIESLAIQPTFGRVKLQKIAFLAEAHVGINELAGSYAREAAGPLDRAMIHEMESGACSIAGVEVQQAGGTGTTVSYQLNQQRGSRPC